MQPSSTIRRRDSGRRHLRRRPSGAEGIFVLRYVRVDIHDSARRHGIRDGDIEHAVSNALSTDVLDEGTDDERLLLLGPDRAGNILEIVMLMLQDLPIAIHAMSMRPKYRKMLPKDGVDND